MCRALRGLGQRQPRRSPSPKTARPDAADRRCRYAPDYYATRLDHLRRVLKPYRDNNANRLRTAAGSGCRSARVNLNRHWKSLENLLAPPNHRKECRENAANEKLQNVVQHRRHAVEDGENAGPTGADVADDDDDDDPTSDAAERLDALTVGR